MTKAFQHSIAQAAAVLAGASRIAVLTGAGVSAESGVATFRDAQTGLWSHFDAHQLASQAGFSADPGLVTVTSVPEPRGSVLMLVLAICACLVNRKHRPAA